MQKKQQSFSEVLHTAHPKNIFDGKGNHMLSQNKCEKTHFIKVGTAPAHQRLVGWGHPHPPPGKPKPQHPQKMHRPRTRSVLNWRQKLQQKDRNPRSNSFGLMI